ncbi:MAG: CrcB family protein [Muribaculaceae bacterium]|nr:CrcB family protein [Muribaculaceae bacterium]
MSASVLNTLLDIAFVAAGGALGATSRYGVEHMGIFDNDKYYYTVAINITGCLVIGILWGLLHYWNAPRGWYLFLLTGFLGGYTTYSAFTLDAIELIHKDMPWRALWYVAITFIGGLGGCAAGFYSIMKIFKINY